MKVLAFVLCSLAVDLVVRAEICSSEKCLPADGCRCADVVAPISDGPQLITMAFNDAVTDAIYTQYLSLLLVGRTNPDGVQIGATFYVPHEYTDYERVNQLYNLGMDIAVHSISKNYLSSYWSEATEDTLYDEFYGQKVILNAFGNIPSADIVGARTPGFEIQGDTTFAAYERAGIKYDNSWVYLSNRRTFPFSLHYTAEEPCQIGSCPKSSFTQTWVIPVISLVGTTGIECNSISGCIVEAESRNDVKNWLMQQFQRHYNNSKAPMVLNLNAAWFATSEYNLPGFIDFLDELGQYPDVFLVDHKQVLDWMKNPVPASQFVTATTMKSAPCSPDMCALAKGDETRYMKTCSYCPDVFPWVGNPLGQI